LDHLARGTTGQGALLIGVLSGVHQRECALIGYSCREVRGSTGR
jgi:hypothetical protein